VATGFEMPARPSLRGNAYEWNEPFMALEGLHYNEI
jgi:hypothetical protein